MGKKSVAATPAGDAGAALLMHRIVYDAFKAANGGAALTAPMATDLGKAATGPYWYEWKGIAQSGTFTITADATAARRMDEDENGTLRQLAAKTHTIKVKDSHVSHKTLLEMKKIYEGKTTLLSDKMDGAVTSALAAICPDADKCTEGNTVKGDGGLKDQKPAYTAADGATFKVTKPTGWTLGTKAGTAVTGNVNMKLTITTGTTADQLKADTVFVETIKYALVEAMKKGNAAVTDLPGFKITSLTWARRMEDARMLAADTERDMKVGWSAEVKDAAAAAAVTAEAKKTTFGADFETKFGDKITALGAGKRGTMGDAAKIKAGSATVTAAVGGSSASTTSSAVATFASGLLFSLLSLSLM